MIPLENMERVCARRRNADYGIAIAAIEMRERLVPARRLADRGGRLQQGNEIIRVLALPFPREYIKDNVYRARSIGCQRRRPQIRHLDPRQSAYVGDLFGIGRDNDLVEPLHLQRKADRPIDQGNAEKVSRVLAGQAFRTTARRNDSQCLQSRTTLLREKFFQHAQPDRAAALRMKLSSRNVVPFHHRADTVAAIVAIGKSIIVGRWLRGK